MREQREGLAQVSAVLSELDQAAQGNAMMVEESATSAQRLRERAGRLNEAVARFVLPGVAGRTAQDEASAKAAWDPAPSVGEGQGWGLRPAQTRAQAQAAWRQTPQAA